MLSFSGAHQIATAAIPNVLPLEVIEFASGSAGRHDYLVGCYALPPTKQSRVDFLNFKSTDSL